MWLQSPLIGCTHGFSTREGGFSAGPFASLNLGGKDDDPHLIEKNRKTAVNALGLKIEDLCFLKQVHGTEVKIARRGCQEGDALVTSEKKVILAVGIADCFPVLFYDDMNQVAAAAHAGWRGTCGGIIVNTVSSMLSLGASVQNIKVAIGQGICEKHFEVGPEVIAEFASKGFPAETRTPRSIDLEACIRWQLAGMNIADENVWSLKRCTWEADFFSYRRDKGITGRMWAVISLNP